MSVCEPVCRPSAAKEEPDFGALSGLELQHDLYLTLPDWTAWADVSARLIDVGAELHNLQISRQTDGFSARCRLKRLTSEAARGLSGALLEEGLVRRASVEHLMLAKTGAGLAP